MRRWFRKKDQEPAEPESEAASPQAEESEELHSQALGEETSGPPASQESGPIIDTVDTVPPSEALAGEDASAEIPPEVEAVTETGTAAPRRGLFQRLFGPDEPLDEFPAEAGPAPAAVSPAMEPPAAMPAEPEEEAPAPAWEAEEGIIELEEVLAEEERALEIRKRRFRRFREGLARTRKTLAGGLESLFLGDREVDAEVLEELEEILISADIGVDTSLHLVEVIRDKVKRRELRNAARLKEALREEMVALLSGPPPPPRLARPWVVLLVGVNGVGKTTTIAKLAYQDRKKLLTPLLIAADTFRAAAVEQLEIWGQRAGAQVVKQKTGADPAAVVYDGITAALARGADMVYVDTAGRLHTKVNLMEELKKIHRTAAKKLPGAPHETLLILDATTGQNALSQARLFHEAVGVTGIILTKLDGTAKGGMALAVAHETGLPLRYLGVGEGMDDLQPFDAEAFVAAILD
jgi:fused signal recognition particle receptor